MPVFALILGIVLVYLLHQLITHSQRGNKPARWVLGGGMIVSLLLASRVFGARVLYAFIPAIQRWMTGDEQTASAAPPATSSYMSRKEAALILGIEENAPAEEVRSAYKKLMLKLHPDAGGNDYLAGKLNQARETLLS